MLRRLYSSSSLRTTARRLENKVAVVTGGASGIGEAICRLFAAQGSKVIIADLAEENALKICKDIEGTKFVHCDVTNEQDMENAVQSAIKDYGKLDIMVNNAGTMDRKRTIEEKSKLGFSVADIDFQEFGRVMDVNVKGCALGIKYAARAMVLGGHGGSIVCTASVASVVAGGLGGHAYVASKHAVVGLVKNAAAELGKHRIRVNAVSPFGVPTHLSARYMKDIMMDGGAEVDITNDDLVTIEKLVRDSANLKGVSLLPSDVAEATLFLASDSASYISGHNLLVDGGFSIAR